MNRITFNDSPSSLIQVFTGTIVVKPDTSSYKMWTKATFASTFGKTFDRYRDFVVFLNGDATANDAHVDGCSINNAGDIYAVFNKSTTSNIRINYLVILRKL